MFFAYGTTVNGNSRCTSKGCHCYCEVPGSKSCSQIPHSGFDLYQFKTQLSAGGKDACTACPGGRYTTSVGAGKSKASCIALQMQIFTSSHRLWLGMPAQGPYRCIVVTIEAYDLAQSQRGPKLIEDPLQAKVCTISNNKLPVNADNNWYRFPLDWQNIKEFKSVNANPGQQLHVTLTPVGSNGEMVKDPLLTIRKTISTVCGCVDSSALLAPARAKLSGVTSQADLKCARNIGTDGLVTERVDCVPPEIAVLPTTATWSTPYRTDSTGKPGNFAVTQDHGRALFSWVDYSLCERTFSFTRDGKGFMDDYQQTSESQCGEVIKTPEANYDDLLTLKDGEPATPGTVIQYCIAAASTVSAGAGQYRSASVCTKPNFVVGFETVLKGIVVTKYSRLPVEDVNVSYRVLPTNTSGWAMTAKDGSFKLHVRDFSALSNDVVRDVLVSFRKQKGSVKHLFECDGELCGPGVDKLTGNPLRRAERLMKLRHMTFDHQVTPSTHAQTRTRRRDPLQHTKRTANSRLQQQIAGMQRIFSGTCELTICVWQVEFTEVSSLPFSGMVSFPAVPPRLLVRGASAPSKWPWGQPADTAKPNRQCALRGAEVCLYEYPDRMTLGCT